MIEIATLTISRAVQIHDVKMSGAGLDPRESGVQRIVVVDLLAAIIALRKAYGLAVAYVYCRKKNHAVETR